MTPIELTLTTLGEQATTEIAKTNDAQGMRENLQAAKKGGSIAGVARLQIQEATKKNVVSNENHLTERQKKNMELGGSAEKMIKDLLDPQNPHREKDK
jgi:hypothetical protein